MSHFQLVRGTDSAFSRIQAPLWVEAQEATKILFLIFSSAVDFSDKHENVVSGRGDRHQPVLRVRHAERGQDDDCGVRVKAIKACDWHLAREH